jgi:hypothetical protein
MLQFMRSVGGGLAAFAALLLFCCSAMAQPAAPGSKPGEYGWAASSMMGPGMMGGGNMAFMCSPRSAGMAEWRINRIEAAIKPNDAQKSALGELRAASTKAAASIAAACAAEVPKSSTERLALMEKRMEALLQAIKTVRPSFDTFYNTLEADQKARLDAAGPRRWGWGNWHWRWR